MNKIKKKLYSKVNLYWNQCYIATLNLTRCGAWGNLHSKWANRYCTAGIPFSLEDMVRDNQFFELRINCIPMQVLVAKIKEKREWFLICDGGNITLGYMDYQLTILSLLNIFLSTN